MRAMLTAIVAVTVTGCAVAGEPAGGGQGAQRSAAEAVDLTGAHLDKRKFLLAASMLGQSAEQDIELLSKMTGVTIEPKLDQQHPLRGTRKSFRIFVRLLGDDQVSGNVSYVYGNGEKDQYIAAVTGGLSWRFACIEMEDLQPIFGKPDRIFDRPPSPHAKKTGPNSIWTARYILSSDAVISFSFQTQVCARDFGLVRNLPLRRN